MQRTMFPQPFPQVDDSGLVGKAFHEAKVVSQASDAMVMLTQLSAIAVALQGLINVETPTGGIKPVSIFALTIADSGERKSTVDNLLTKGLRDFQRDQLEIYQKNLKRYAVSVDVHNKIARKIKNKIAATNVQENHDIITELTKHHENCPTKPRSPMVIYEDSTSEALLCGLNDNSPNALLGSNEGGVLFKSRVMANTAKLNALWSGDEVSINRKTAESFKLTDVRLTIHIMAQPSAVEQYMDKFKEEVRGNGFLARMLVCAPQGTCGMRFSNGIKHETNAIDAFNDRLYQLLKSASELIDYADRKVVSFCPEAKNMWLEIFNDIEMKMSPGGIYQYAKDHASKLADNIARVAALLHYVEQPLDTFISTESLMRAVNFMRYFSHEFLRIFCTLPKPERDANELWLWIKSFLDVGFRYLPKNYILQYGPICIRNIKSLEDALNIIKSRGLLAEIKYGRAKMIDLCWILPFEGMRLYSECARIGYKLKSTTPSL